MTNRPSARSWFLKPVFAVSLFFAALLPAHAQDAARAILRKTEAVLRGKTSIRYTAQFRQKFFSRDDTVTVRGEVKLRRVPGDTLFGGLVWLSTTDTTRKFYDRRYLYVVNDAKRKAERFFPEKGQDWAINGNTSGELIWASFLRPEGLEKRRDAKNTLSLRPDTVIQNQRCRVVQIRYPDEEDLSDHVRWVYISRLDDVPVLTKRKIRFQGNYQYDEFRLLTYRFDDVTEAAFSADQIPATYPLTDFVEDNTDPQDLLLKKGSVAPVVAGRWYQQALRADSVQFAGKVTLLDFWYMGCLPCIKAMPQLEKLREKYGPQGLQVVGINAFDNTDKGTARLPQFLEQNPIQYPIFLVDRTLPKAYGVQVWPTFYLIDRQGTVYHATLGYSDNLGETLSGFIEELLKK